jgi:glutamate-1-semialdehyde 2,1-aminomutase
MAAVLAVIETYQREQIARRLHETGASLRRQVDLVISAAGLSDYLQLRGRDCNLVYVARDEHGEPSQAFRTLVLQELIERGILAPSFVVSAAHDERAISQTVEAVAAIMPAYRRALEQGADAVVRGRYVRPGIRARG